MSREPCSGKARATGNAIGLAPAFALALAVAVCGRAGPSSDWSGRYGTRVLKATTDCLDSDSPPTMTGFLLDLTLLGRDSAAVTMSPIIRLAGRFDADHLSAGMKIQEPIGLPDSFTARATPADSLDTITYALEAEFGEDGFRGDYVIRAPDLRALFEDGGGRCEYRYELAGQRLPTALPPGESR